MVKMENTVLGSISHLENDVNEYNIITSEMGQTYGAHDEYK